MKKNKGFIVGFIWLLGTIIFIKILYKNTSWEGIILLFFFIFSIIWFVFSLFQIYYGLKFFLSNQRWSYYTSKQWVTYLASGPLLIASFLLYVNYLK